MKFKCRPADECYWDDPYYTREIDLPNYITRAPEYEAAQEFAAEWCNERSEYDEMEVQVLTADGWVTFEVGIRSVPEFVATKKKGVDPVPDTFRCNECDKRLPKSELVDQPFIDVCKACDAELAKEVVEEDE